MSTLSFNEYCRRAMMEEERCRGLHLKSFLIMPIQRVPRYVLLLKELVKQIHKVFEQDQGRKKNDDSSTHLKLEIVSIVKSLHSFEAVARQIDHKIDEQEDSYVFVRLVEKLDWSRTRLTKSDILQPGRTCVLVGGESEGSRMLRTTSSKHARKKMTLFWLFTDMLCYGTSTILGRYVLLFCFDTLSFY